jgi:predicted dithiol-disulfide oxidoreductase (DUF899 family)
LRPSRPITRRFLERLPEDKLTWKPHKWYSSFGSDCNRDYNVSFTKDEVVSQKIYYNYNVQFFPREKRPAPASFTRMPTATSFIRIRPTDVDWSPLMGVDWLDLAPKGRDEQDQKLHPMAWVRHHDRYEKNNFADTAESTKSAAAGHNLLL